MMLYFKKKRNFSKKREFEYQTRVFMITIVSLI